MTLGYVQDDGIKDWLTDLIAGALFDAMKLRLYTNSITWSDATAIGGVTEATFAGYAAVTLAGWGAVSVTAHVASSVATIVTFTLTSGSQNINGAYGTNAGNTKLYFGQADPNAPVTLNTTVSVYQVTVTVTLQSVN